MSIRTVACPSCGIDLEVKDSKVLTCELCGHQMILEDEKKMPDNIDEIFEEVKRRYVSDAKELKKTMSGFTIAAIVLFVVVFVVTIVFMMKSFNSANDAMMKKVFSDPLETSVQDSNG